MVTTRSNVRAGKAELAPLAPDNLEKRPVKIRTPKSPGEARVTKPKSKGKPKKKRAAPKKKGGADKKAKKDEEQGDIVMGQEPDSPPLPPLPPVPPAPDGPPYPQPYPDPAPPAYVGDKAPDSPPLPPLPPLPPAPDGPPYPQPYPDPAPPAYAGKQATVEDANSPTLPDDATPQPTAGGIDEDVAKASPVKRKELFTTVPVSPRTLQARLSSGPPVVLTPTTWGSKTSSSETAAAPPNTAATRTDVENAGRAAGAAGAMMARLFNGPPGSATSSVFAPGSNATGPVRHANVGPTGVGQNVSAPVLKTTSVTFSRNSSPAPAAQKPSPWAVHTQSPAPAAQMSSPHPLGHTRSPAPADKKLTFGAFGVERPSSPAPAANRDIFFGGLGRTQSPASAVRAPGPFSHRPTNSPGSAGNELTSGGERTPSQTPVNPASFPFGQSLAPSTPESNASGSQPRTGTAPPTQDWIPEVFGRRLSPAPPPERPTLFDGTAGSATSATFAPGPRETPVIVKESETETESDIKADDLEKLMDAVDENDGEVGHAKSTEAQETILTRTQQLQRARTPTDLFDERFSGPASHPRENAGLLAPPAGEEAEVDSLFGDSEMAGIERTSTPQNVTRVVEELSRAPSVGEKPEED